MIKFKKNEGKSVNLKKDYSIKLDSVISKNLDIDDTELDGEKVMMNLDKGQYFMMNEVGSRIWDIIDNTTSVKGVIDILCDEYEVDKKACEDTVIEFLGSLNHADLISIS